MPPPLAQSEVYHSSQIARILAVMATANPNFLEPCQLLRVIFHCMPQDRGEGFILADIRNTLKTLLYQRPDYYEAIKVFRGYVGLQEAFEDYGQRKPTLLPVDW